jgi:hypothetical protein
MKSYDDKMPDHLRATAERLQDSRPQPDDGVLERAKQHAVSRGGSGAHIPRGGFMKSRIAIAAVLATGLIMSGGGASLAISGISSQGSAAVIQYPTDTTPGSGNSPIQEEGGSGEGNSPGGADLGAVAGKTGDVQAARQAGSNGRQSLPFTGLAAIPLLLLGLVVTGGGLMMRRRADENPSA